MLKSNRLSSKLPPKNRHLRHSNKLLKMRLSLNLSSERTHLKPNLRHGKTTLSANRKPKKLPLKRDLKGVNEPSPLNSKPTKITSALNRRIGPAPLSNPSRRPANLLSSNLPRSTHPKNPSSTRNGLVSSVSCNWSLPLRKKNGPGCNSSSVRKMPRTLAVSNCWRK